MNYAQNRFAEVQTDRYIHPQLKIFESDLSLNKPKPMQKSTRVSEKMSIYRISITNKIIYPSFLL